MLEPKLPINEQERLKALERYDIMDTLPEEDFDNITYIASFICKTPISLISLVDENRLFYKSHLGTDISVNTKYDSFCGHAINEPDTIFTVEDARLDKRFHDNPVVAGQPGVVFYAGIPLVTKDGFALGTLCVLDIKPHILSEEQKEVLRRLSKQVMYMLEIREKRKLEERFRLIDFSFRHASTPISFIKEDGSLFDFNDATSNLLGYTREEYQNLTVQEINPLFDSEKWVARWKDVKANGDELYQTRLKKKDGSLLDIEVRTNIIKYENTEIKCSTYIDLTEKKKTEEKLNLVDFSLRNAATPILLLLPDASFYDFNEAMVDLLGYTKEEFNHLTIPDIDPSFDKAFCEVRWEQFRQVKRITFLNKLKKKNGSFVDVEVRNNLIIYSEKEVNFCFITDITEKIRLENNLKIVDYAFRNATIPMHFIKKDGTVYDYNDAACELFGYNKEEYKNLTIFDFSTRHTPQTWRERWESLKTRDELPHITKLKKKDNSLVDVEVRTDIFEYENSNLSFTSFIDITEKKKAEVEKEHLLNELIQNNKELTQFSYITTHNLRAPLTNLISICSLIKTDKIEDERTLKLIEGFKISTHYLNDTLNDLIKVLIIKDKPHWKKEQVSFKEIFEKVKTFIYMKLTDMAVTTKEDFSKAPSVLFSNAYMPILNDIRSLL
jgi:PAS domain S-box-containing protein